MKSIKILIIFSYTYAHKCNHISAVEQKGTLWSNFYRGIEKSDIEDNANIDLAFIDPRNGAAGVNIISINNNKVLESLKANPQIVEADANSYTTNRLFNYIFEVKSKAR